MLHKFAPSKTAHKKYLDLDKKFAAAEAALAKAADALNIQGRIVYGVAPGDWVAWQDKTTTEMRDGMVVDVSVGPRGDVLVWVRKRSKDKVALASKSTMVPEWMMIDPPKGFKPQAIEEDETTEADSPVEELRLVVNE